MGKSNSKFQQIGTFDQFCKEREKKKLNESQEVAIDVPFYDEAVTSVLNDIHSIAGNPVIWGALINYLKMKYTVIDRDIVGDDSLVIAHIRDILFQRYGESILGGDIGCLTYDAAELGAKSLVISTLSTEILRKIRIEAGIEIEPEPEPEVKPLVTVSLDNVCYDEEEDLPFESRIVKSFKHFSSMLNEGVAKIKSEHDEKAIEYCLNTIEKAAGSLKADDIMKAASKDGYETLNGYIRSIVENYLQDYEVEFNGKKLKENDEQATILKQARKLFAYQVVGDVIAKINKENNN